MNENKRGETFVVSTKGNKSKFHRRSCEWAEHFLPTGNYLEFSSHEEALEAGYQPCKTCQPTVGYSDQYARTATEPRNEDTLLKKIYEPEQIEQRRYREWEASDCFAPSGDGTPYCIMIPPPNVTGTLHMGHAFQATLIDCLIRYHRMRGFRTLWQAGTDHAGIATQMVVERRLEAEGIKRHELGREQFVEKVWQWKHTSGNTITRQLRRLGASLDWQRERFTMDEDLSDAVLEAFVRLYDEGLIYRGKRLVNWDPVLRTAVSDLEVISEEEDGHLWHLRYPFTDGGHITVSTTRPETMLGDTAVAVHPDDARYRTLVGRRVTLPLSKREIPIIADDYVDPEFGSGCVKITPAHDFNDYRVGKRHQLPMINVMAEDATLNREVPAKYRGMDRYEARKHIVADLERLGLLEQMDERKMVIPRGDRSGAVIEPYLTDQWFVRTEALAEAAKQAVSDGRIHFIPDNWSKTYFEWMNHIEDWCISRQLWWGHRIPAWYDEQGKLFVAHSETQARQKYQLDDNHPLRRDEDVLDTWFSSALWPFSTLGWPQQTRELKTFYPTRVLVTGFDIIFFWVARMIMMGIKLTGDIPFHEVYVHGLVRDAQGRKMSKSKGNVLDPIDLVDGISLEELINKRLGGLMQPQLAERIESDTRKQFAAGIPAYGTDALRFTFTAMATSGRDIRFDLGRIEGYRNFCNKLWNAARFIVMCCPAAAPKNGAAATPYDRWISHRLHELSGEVRRHFESYRFDLAAAEIYEFVWHDFCDWYLELSKTILNGDADHTLKAGNRNCLVKTLETILRLLHPITPYITEEIWQQIKPLSGYSETTIQRRPYPAADDTRTDETAVQDVARLREIVVGLRRVRAELDLPPGKPLPLIVQNWSAAEREHFTRHHDAILALAAIKHITWAQPADHVPQASIALVGEMKLLVPLAELIDAQAEINRLEKRSAKIDKQLKGAQARLENQDFVGKAPAEVITVQRETVAACQTQIKQLEEQIATLRTLV